MPDGHTYTVPAATRLKRCLCSAPFDVYFDHGDATEAQTIVAWAGDAYVEPRSPKQLAQLDIAVVDPSTDHVVCLIEIEDTTDNPKTLIGDLVAPLLSSGIAIGQKTDYVVDEGCTMIVFAHFGTAKAQQTYTHRLEIIQDGVAKMLTALADDGDTLGGCILDSFVNQDQLDQRLWEHVQSALSRYEARDRV